MQKVEAFGEDGEVVNAACVFNQSLVMIMAASARIYNKKNNEDFEIVKSGDFEKRAIKISISDLDDDCDKAFAYMQQKAQDVGGEVVVFDNESGFSPIRELLVVDNRKAMCFLDIMLGAYAEYEGEECDIIIDPRNAQIEGLHNWFSNNIRGFKTDKVEQVFEVLGIAAEYENMTGEPYGTINCNNAEVYGEIYGIFKNAEQTPVSHF